MHESWRPVYTSKSYPGWCTFKRVMEVRNRICCMYSGFPIIRIPIVWTIDYPNTWTLPCSWQQREKDAPVTGVLLQEKAKLLYERLFPDATTPFSASTGSRFTTSEITIYNVRASWAKHCTTANAVVHVQQRSLYRHVHVHVAFFYR